MKRSSPYIIIVSIIAFWCLLLILPSLLAVLGGPVSGMSEQLYRSFSKICHQYDSRSLHLFGYKLAVCARCSAIYFGFFIGVLLSPLLKRDQFSHARYWWVLAILPMVIDVLLDFFGISQSNTSTRLSTGGFFGVLAALILTPIIEEVLNTFTNRFQLFKGVQYESKT
ncbi:MAG TPA: DUF2085 domain-containing protein [Bacteroidota bacterium]|nr:DUF2085 domain-containing protein [Bacteroidota bacterium]